MNFYDWFTDTVTVYRSTGELRGNLTKKERTLIYEDIPCRVYSDSNPAPTMSQTAAYLKGQSKIAMDNQYNIFPGDELIISRGGRIGQVNYLTRGFAGDAHRHFEPFGAVMPQLAHQEITVMQEERI